MAAPFPTSHEVAHSMDPELPSPDEIADRAARFNPPPKRTGGRTGNILWSILGVLIIGTWLLAWYSAMADTLPPSALVLVTILPYIAVTLIVASFTLWILTPDHKLSALLVGFATIAPVLTWAPSWPSRPSAEPGEELRVVSWNVQRLWADGSSRNCVRDTLQAQAPDLVMLQELTPGDAAQLGGMLGMDCTHARYATSDGDDAAGVATCAPRDGRWRLGRSAPRRFTTDDDWQFLDAFVTHGDRQIRVLNVHLAPHRIQHDPMNALPEARKKAPSTLIRQQEQSQALLATTLQEPLPTLVAGDFNSTRDAPIHHQFREHLTDTWDRAGTGMTWTVKLLGLFRLRIDYIYATRDLAVAGADVIDATCSDHRPVTSLLRLKSPGVDATEPGAHPSP